jgi:hypothetical protein
VPKADGSNRTVSVFQVADAAVSRLIFRSLLEKNRQRLSAYSFAYRRDLTVHDAIQHIAADIVGRERIFIAEYDFAKYFQSILHEHIWRILQDQRFLVTDLEHRVLDAFLKVPTADIATYVESGGDSRIRGLPEGTSVSLFLANVAAWPLDRSLERLGVGFARFADDTLIWSHDYSRICEAAEVLNESARLIGATLNLKKSEGISILAPAHAPAEFKTKSSVEFVGYSFSSGRIGIRLSAQSRIKRRISKLIFHNLLEQPKNGVFVADRIAPPVDRDYVTMVRQIRRYLYGDLSEERLIKYLSQSAPCIRYKGVMAFYPLVDDFHQLQELDGWLLRSVHSTLKKRRSLFEANGIIDLPPPAGLSMKEIIGFASVSSEGFPLDLRLPSFVRIGRVLHRAAMTYGPNAIAHPKSNRYYFHG